MSTTTDTTTRHEYTDAEIIKAVAEAIQAPNMGTFTLPWFRAFLSALPERPQAQPGPWPGQQEAIDEAFLKSDQTWLYADDGDQRDWDAQAPARLAIAQAYDKARPQAVEIASLKNALFQAQEASKDLLDQHNKLKEELTHAERWRDKVDTKLTEVVEAAERAGWEGVENSKNLPTFITDLAEDLSKAQAELAALRQSYEPANILGQLQQLACEEGNAEAVKEIQKYASSLSLEGVNSLLKGIQECLPPILAAKAVVAAARPAIEAEALAQAVRRMEAVPVKDLAVAGPYHGHQEVSQTWALVEAVRARLITAAKGDGQVQADDGPPWIPHDGGPCPLKDEEVEEWECQWVEGDTTRWSSFLPPSQCEGWDSIAKYRVLKWKPGHGPQASSKADEPAQPWTPKPGDVVRLKSGGPVMTVTEWSEEKQAWKCMGEAHDMIWIFWISAACLTPAQP